MFGYNPTLKEYIGIPFAFGLAAYAIAVNFPSPEAFVFLWAVEINVAIVPSIFLIRQYIQQEDDMPEPKKEQRPVVANIQLPRVTSGGMVINSQVVQGVKFHKVRNFASTLLNMRAVSESSVDLREDTWRVHFGGRDGYIKTRIRFEQVGAFVRKDARPNSPYVVKRWEVVEAVAHGNERVLQ